MAAATAHATQSPMARRNGLRERFPMVQQRVLDVRARAVTFGHCAPETTKKHSNRWTRAYQ